MRTNAAVLFALVLGLGCWRQAGPATPPTAPSNGGPVVDSPQQAPQQASVQNTPPTKPAADPGPPIDVVMTDLVNDYRRNQLGADAKYKGKKLRVNMMAEKIGKRGDRAYIGACSVADNRLPPNMVCYLADPADPKAAALKSWEWVVMEGVCEGRVDDGIIRLEAGSDFHVVVNNCTVAEVGKKPDAVTGKKSRPTSR